MIKKLFMLALLGLLIAMAVPSSRARLVTPVLDRIRNYMAPRKVDLIANQLMSHTERGEVLPPTLDEWIERNGVGSSTDPWGNPYYLLRQRRGFTVGSMGADGVQGTPDDFTAERRYGR